MSNLPERSDISKREFARGRRLKTAAVAAPIVLAGIPAVVFTTLFLLFGATPPLAATFLFFGLILTLIGFVLGLGLSGFFMYRHSNWSQRNARANRRTRHPSAEEIDWFNER